MKKSIEEFKAELKNFISSMTREEFEASLNHAGFDFYKNIRMPIFSESPDLAPKHSRKGKVSINRVQKGVNLKSLKMPQNFYENVQIPLFRIFESSKQDWKIVYTEPIVNWTTPLFDWYPVVSNVDVLIKDIIDVDYDLAA